MEHHNRLMLVNLVNPDLYNQILDFVKENPEFYVLLPYAAITIYPLGFNKNPGEPFDPSAPKNIFETLIYTIAHAGVKTKYGYEQYKQLVTYLRTIDYFEENMDYPFKVQPKKLQTYKDLINILLQKDININKMTLNDLELVKEIKGIGVTAISMCEQLFGDGQIVPYTDRHFKNGFSKLYNIQTPTKKQILDITNKWTNKKIGTMFIRQCHNYY